MIGSPRTYLSYLARDHVGVQLQIRSYNLDTWNIGYLRHITRALMVSFLIFLTVL